jgi:hypothetical protein
MSQIFLLIDYSDNLRLTNKIPRTKAGNKIAIRALIDVPSMGKNCPPYLIKIEIKVDKSKTLITNPI